MGQKHLRATMSKSDFTKFKQMMYELGADTNDEAIMQLVDEYNGSPSVEEAIEVLEDEGYEVSEDD